MLSMMSISLNQIVLILSHRIKQMIQLINKQWQILKKRLQKYLEAQSLMQQTLITNGSMVHRHSLR